MKSAYKVNQWITCKDFNEVGRISKVRYDDRGEPLIDVTLESGQSLVCRECEIEPYPPKMRLRNFAYHVQEIATTPAPAKFSLHPTETVSVNVEIKPAADLCNSSIWDTVYIDGMNCGNRSGGVQRFAEITAQALNLKDIQE